MPMAYKMNAGFIPVRKPNKLPAATYSQEYALEYGTDKIEIHQDAIPKGANVLIVDDLLATGGTAEAAAKLVRKAGGNLVGMAFLIELEGLNGKQKLADVPRVVSMLKY
jgi:adenine phosphoribosyltransferase